MTDVGAQRGKRALILAGGGIKVAFQAGVLQVWLDEAGQEFDYVDGASGGTLNLAMLCQGMSGRRIADNWRYLSPLLLAQPNWPQYARLFYAESLLKLDRLRNEVFSQWGLTWGGDGARTAEQRAVAKGVAFEASFNVYNFSKHKLEVLSPDQMTGDYLSACVALPMWFPPVRINGDLYIDAVFMTDANIERAIERGADEIWAIWTVSERGDWYPGFIATYFQIIEATANGHFRHIEERIKKNNDDITAGGTGEFKRHIDLKVLRDEVPIHYLIDVGADRLHEMVDRGVQKAREWCALHGISLDYPEDVYPTALTSLRFSEEMRGYFAFGETDYRSGFARGRSDRMDLRVHLTVVVDGIDRFVTDPRHEARLEGYVRCDALGGQRPVEAGVFHLFVDEGDPTRKKMLYRAFFRDGAGHPLTLSGHKDIDPGSNIWRATTTLYTKIVQGHCGPEDEAQAEVVGSGIIRIHPRDFLRELTTFRANGPTFGDRASALARFGALFLGKLWDVYARRVLSYGPF